MKIGQYVEWQTKNSNGGITARAGKIVAVVPAYTHPNEVYPGQHFHANALLRQDESYIIWIPKYNVIMWPGAKLLKPLVRSRAGLLLTQAKPSMRVKTVVNRSDRIKLIQIAKALSDAFEDAADSLTVPAWGKRFVFEIADSIESIVAIEAV